jgi:hypothetical protein
MLLFKKKFLDAIRSGEKSQTIRLWQYRRMKIGQHSYIPGVGYIRVASVDAVQLAELTENDALRDGFASADLLRREIAELYPEKLAAGYQAYRIRFRVLSAEEAEAFKANRAALRAANTNGASRRTPG